MTIVLFGATGFTGRLTAEALVGRGERPLLAGRSRPKLAALAASLGSDEPLPVATADVDEPASVTALVGPGDVLISTVGPFARWGGPAVEAAIAAGIPYLDSTGEPTFVRRVFEEYGPRAAGGGAALITAFGYDYVPGNLAGALALREATEEAVAVQVGYFVGGDAGPGSLSTGTVVSLTGALFEPGFEWHNSRLHTIRGGARSRSFDVGGRKRWAVSVPGSEHFALPQHWPSLRDVGVYLGGFGPASAMMPALSWVNAGLGRMPGLKGRAESLARRVAGRSGEGPDGARRARQRTEVLAHALDRNGQVLAEVRLEGPDPYEFTAAVLAWGAQRAAAGDVKGTGALGPVDAFGLDPLAEACAALGLRQV